MQVSYDTQRRATLRGEARLGSCPNWVPLCRMKGTVTVLIAFWSGTELLALG